MQNGIMLDVRLWVAGEAEPTVDWAAQALQEILAAGKTQYPQLTLTVLNLAEQTNFDDYEWDRSTTPPLPRRIGPAPLPPAAPSTPPIDSLDEIN